LKTLYQGFFESIIYLNAERKSLDYQNGDMGERFGLATSSILQKNEENDELYQWMKIDRNRKLINYWLEEMGVDYAIAVSASAARSKSICLTERSTEIGELSLTQVGHGIGAILSVLRAALDKDKRLVLLEEPSAHVHPALQAELIEVLMKICEKENKQCIVETHSEHSILRLDKMVRHGGIGAESIAITAVARDDKGAYQKQIRLSDNGGFRDPWPGGFFPERSNEILG
jgi:predicted ATPase